MNNNLALNEDQGHNDIPDEVLKITALEYLKEALLREQYEKAPALTQNAKALGAEQKEIKTVIAQAIKKGPFVVQNEANQRVKTQPRF